MRYEKGHKDTTHDRILQVAARRFREDGITGAGVAGIMSDAGLTKGGFYAHFDSKNEMIEKSLKQAIDGQWEQFEKEIASGNLLNIVRVYLSKEHRDDPGGGCPSAALLPEISRQDEATRRAYTESLERLLHALAGKLRETAKGPTPREAAIACVGLLVGILQLARAVNDASLSEELLSAGTQVATTLIQSSGGRR
jgi:TetR/AcrR family transcriptional regulator, transcriptional repressor for nem operon